MGVLVREDSFEEASRQNHALAVLLEGEWKPLTIVKIERIEQTDPDAGESGWKVHYR